MLSERPPELWIAWWAYRGDDTKVRKLSGSRSSRVQQFELEHDFQGASKVAVYRKALFRGRNQTRKRTLFTLGPRPDALRSVFQPLNRRKFTLNALNCPIWVLSNRTILTLSCRHPNEALRQNYRSLLCATSKRRDDEPCLLRNYTADEG